MQSHTSSVTEMEIKMIKPTKCVNLKYNNKCLLALKVKNSNGQQNQTIKTIKTNKKMAKSDNTQHFNYFCSMREL